LCKAILSFGVVKAISKVIRGEHEYKANTEVLFDKIYDLVNKGLNDSVPDWNEVKQAEMARYLRTQKREGQKRPRSARRDKTELESVEPSTVDTQLENSVVDPKKDVA
jgi:hypothetical protein